MPIETFSFVNSLIPTNPIHTDPLSEADSHLRGIKQTLINTFPNVAGTIAATDIQLERAGSAFTQPGTIEVINNGTVAGGTLKIDGLASGANILMTNQGTVSGPPLLGVLMAQGTTVSQALTLDAVGNLAATTSLNAPSVKKAGNELLPTGIICLWSGSATAVPAGWTLCNGTNGAPDLQDSFIIGAGNLYAVGATGGSTTFTATSSTAGSHSHGGSDGLAGGFYNTWPTDSQGEHYHGGSDGAVALTVAQMPYHDHGMGGDVVLTTGSGSGGGGGAYVNNVVFSGQGGGQTHQHSISMDGLHAHNVTIGVAAHQHSISLDGSHNHTVSASNMPPYYALAFIMKL